MADPYDFTPLRQHMANVISDHGQGGGDGVEDAVQAIFDHPEFAVAWAEYQSTHPKHGDKSEVGGKPMWWHAGERLWKYEPVEP